MTRSLVGGLTSLVCVLGLSVPLHAQQTAPEMTPAELVLKAVNAPPTFSVDVRQALQSTSPALRITAARILAVSGKAPMVPDVIAALEKERAPSVATELVRALALFNTPQSLAAAEAYLPRASRMTAEVFTGVLARSQPEQLLQRLPSIVNALNEQYRKGVYSSATRLALRNRPALREATLRALLEADGPQWGWLVDKLIEDSTVTIDLPIVEAALASARPEHRERTVWAMVNRLGTGSTLPPSLVRSAAPRDDGVRNWEAYGRELIARLQQTPAKGDWPDAIAAFGTSHEDDTVALLGLRVLRLSEINAVREVLGARFPKDWKKPDARMEVAWDSEGPDELAPPIFRVTPPLFPGFLASLNRLSGCNKDRSELAALSFEYGPDGRPSSTGPIGNAGAGCQRALSALAQVTVAQDGVALGEHARDIVFLPTRNELLRCIEEQDTAADDARPPVRTQSVDVRSLTPRSSIARMTISRTGCVKRLAIVQSASPPMEGINVFVPYVLRKTYKTTTLNGRPVEGVVDTIVTFGSSLE